ncbi:MAG: ABC transporter permease subunit [Ruminococcaceae bacterium]|nr:ABC transporter permease subunit [Oscillospiraceae bacterium]
MAEKKDHKQNNTASEKKSLGYVLATPFRWLFRMFFGASKTMANDIFAVEKLESPTKQAVKSFFRRKIAVTALVVLVALFLFVFIGPLFIPMDLTYSDALQANIAPNYEMLSVPSGLKDDVRDINGYANFTVGVSNDNTLYMWGYTKDALTKVDYKNFPEEIQPGKVFMAAAGTDHIIAITTDGKVVGWGDRTRGQYGEANAADALLQMPDFVMNGTLDTSKVQQLVCGYQSTALVYDGQLYMWGNTRAVLNMNELLELTRTYTAENNTRVAKIALSNYYAIVLYEDGTMTGGNTLFNRDSAYSSNGGKVQNFASYLSNKKITDIAATDVCYAFLTESGEVLVAGAFKYGEELIPALEGEKFVELKAGTRHFLGLTDQNKAYAWGHNDKGQASIYGKSADAIFAGAKQSYLTDEEDDLTHKCGMKGYIFGTDGKGRDVFTRIVHGGKMTMTVGAVAVIVSSIIAIIIGCLSGYFGGWVDLLLMRITEIFSAIPFLPFAMMLSFVIRNYPISENTRIFIIMIILGLLSWTGLARMIRGQVLAEREKEFVIAAQSMGVKENRIAFKHILPNVISVILVSMTLDFAGCLLTESSLSYLGFGVQQPRPTWGNMLDGANNSIVIQNYWWQWVFPAIFLSIATISINIIGDTLRDVLDPKSSREK